MGIICLMRNGPYELVIAPVSYPGKRYRGKYAYEHVVVWWKNVGSIPPNGYEIHHVNGEHRDNRFENLKLVTSHEHRILHGQLRRRPPIQFNCGFCGVTSSRRARDYRYKIKTNRSGKLFCSLSCGRKNQLTMEDSQVGKASAC